MRRHNACVLRYFELNATWAAEDLAQRTFMALIESAGRLRDPAAFRAYVLGIARRQLVMHRRALARNKVLHSFDDTARPASQTRLSTLVARTQEQVVLLRALAGLPSAPQLLLVLYYWQGMSTPLLAKHYDVAEVTVRTRMNRARTRLRDNFARMHGRLPPNVPMGDLEKLLRQAIEPQEIR